MARIGGSASRRKKMDEAIARSGTIGKLGAALQSGVDVGGMNFEEIDVDLIDPDPRNARDLSFIDFQNPLATDVELLNSEQREEFEKLKNLANSIRALGRIINPVEVYEKPNGRFHLTAGHRRTLGTKLAGMKRIRAQFCAPDSKKKKLTQWIENNEFSRLSLPERIDAFGQCIDEFRGHEKEYARELHGEGVESLSKTDMSRMMGLDERSFRRYQNVANGPEDVHAAMHARVITDIKRAEEITAVVDAALRKKVISALSKGDMDEYVALLKIVKERAGAKGEGDAAEAKQARALRKPRRGAPMKAVKTKPITNTEVVRYIIERLDVDPDGMIDWTDKSSVTAGWQSVLDKLAAQLSGVTKG